MQLARNVKPAGVWVPFLLGALALLAGWLVSLMLPDYLVFLSITAIIATISLIGLGIVTGTAGMIALCQLTFAAVGAWVVSWLNASEAPGDLFLWIPLGGVAAALAGLVIGLPALRLRGVNLAVVTLGFAVVADATLNKSQFPGTTDGVKVLRPEIVASDRGYFLFSVLVLIVIAVAVYFLQNSRVGSGWRAVNFSERATASSGTNVRNVKLTAFAVSAGIAGIAGGLIAGQVGNAYPGGFTTIQSLALYVLSIVTGSYLVEMALLGGILWVLIPELLKRWGVPQDWGFVVFGVLGIQALMRKPEGFRIETVLPWVSGPRPLTTRSNLGEDLRAAFRRRSRRHRQADEATLQPWSDAQLARIDRLERPSSDSAVLSVRDLSVSFGELKALSGVDLVIPAGSIVGLIGPNGAGKSTLVDAISGFLPQHEGTVLLDGEDISALRPHARARIGLRRSFQQDRVPPSLTVGDYIRFVSHGAATLEEIDEVLELFGCPGRRTRIRDIDVGTRRLIEVAANLAARPKLLVLDEPAAGLSHREHIAFGQRLRAIPAKYGASVLIIEHDLDLVRSVCDSVTVLNFGRVIAEGPQEEVLNDPAVIAAYMGEMEKL